MTGWSILEALKGIGGTYEVQRLLGAFGTVSYVVAVPAFVATGIISGVSVTEFCLAYPSGLAACVGATAGAIALKDRNVATARIIQETGAIPAKPPAGPSVNPQDITSEQGKAP